MEKILVVSPYLPYKNVGHAGGKVIYDFLFHLKKRNFRVYLLSLATPDEVRELDDLKSLCDDTCFLISRPLFARSFLNSFLRNPLSLIFKLPLEFMRYLIIRWRLTRHIHLMIRRHDPDIVQVEYSAMALYFSKIGSKKLKLLHLHDVMLKPFGRLYEAEKKFFRRFFRRLLFSFVKHMEVSFCRQFDTLLVKSEFDKQLLLQHGNFKIAIFPLGIEPVSVIQPYEHREPNSILFVGSMYRDLNEQAAFYFIREALPKLIQSLGHVTFYVVGSSPSQDLKRMSLEHVVVTGYVEDLSLFYHRCRVFVAPLFIGGGMIFKILQAMSFGVPVVSSPIANEGIMAKDRDEILIAHSADDFCNQTSSLLTNKDLWERISNRGRSFVNSKYSWDTVLDHYLRSVQNSPMRK